MNDYNELLKLRHEILGKKSKYEIESKPNKILSLCEIIDMLTKKAKELDSYLESLKYYMDKDIITEENVHMLKETTFSFCLYDELQKNNYFYKKKDDVEPITDDLF